MPRREILDFLTQYYFSDIHWLVSPRAPGPPAAIVSPPFSCSPPTSPLIGKADCKRLTRHSLFSNPTFQLVGKCCLSLKIFRHDQIIEPSSFMDQYQRWWNLDGVLRLLDVEFAVVIMRICSYASLFLPSPSHTIDTVRGMNLADIRSTCDGTGHTLSAMAAEMDRQGSLTRVQHLLLSGLKFRCEGKPHELWNSFRHAAQVAKELGLFQQYQHVSFQGSDLELNNELGCRAICILYIWDK
jgi:hypothetical protein